MAIRWAVANGNWSDTATWDGGTLPTSSDDVHADGKTVTINQDITVITLRTTQRAGGILGGTFRVTSGGISITMSDVTAGTVPGSSSGCIVLAHTTGIVTVNGVIRGGAGTNFFGMSHNSTGTVTVNGTITGSASSAAHGFRFLTGMNATVNVNGTILGGTGSTTNGIQMNTGSIVTLNVVGDIIGGTSSGIGIRSDSLSGNTINIIGNISGGTSVGSGLVILEPSHTITHIGNNIATSSIYATYISDLTNTYTHTGSNYGASNGMMAITGFFKYLIPNSTVGEHRYGNGVGGTKSLYTAGVALGNPATSNVRSGITYGASLELTGTLIVPNPSNVVAGVPTDNTVGTYSTTPALIATEIFTKLLSNSDFNTAGSFGKLIKDNVDAKSSEIKAKTDLIPTNPASVQSVGAIVASYNV